MLKKIIFVLSIVLAANANAGIYTYSNELVVDRDTTKKNDTFYVERQNRKVTLSNGASVKTVDILNNLKPLNEMHGLEQKYGVNKQEEFNETFYEKLLSRLGNSMYFLQDRVLGSALVVFENGNQLIVINPEYRYDEIVRNIVYKGNIFYTYDLTKEQTSTEKIDFDLNFRTIKSSNGIETTIFRIKASDE